MMLIWRWHYKERRMVLNRVKHRENCQPDHHRDDEDCL